MEGKTLRHKAAEIDAAVDKIQKGLDANSMTFDPNSVHSEGTVGKALQDLHGIMEDIINVENEGQ